MSIGNKQRFEILRRDGFRCQYCGRNGKDVVLEVDHIDPKKNGGTDDDDNLITACFECNRGKRATVILPDDSPVVTVLCDTEGFVDGAKAGEYGGSCVHPATAHHCEDCLEFIRQESRDRGREEGALRAIEGIVSDAVVLYAEIEGVGDAKDDRERDAACRIVDWLKSVYEVV